ncbi:MAG: response regulator [Deltaproteobacteria bacterium]|nr:response regulator [Deltaproteobacteria bacterium]
MSNIAEEDERRVSRPLAAARPAGGGDLEGMLLGSADAMLLLDERGVITFANPSAAGLLHATRGALVGTPMERWLESADAEHDGLQLGQRPLERGLVVRGRARGLDGESFPLEVSISPLGGASSGYLAVCRDGSERERLEAQLRQAQKMEAIGRLAGGIAHDLNNVLTVVRSFGELGLEEAAPGSGTAECLTQILEAASRSERLTRQLLAFSRRQAVAPRVLSFNDIVRDTEAMLRRIAGESIEFRTDLDPEAWNVRVDPTHFGQVVMNLVVNARDAMEAGGSLHINTSNVELDAEYAAAHGVELEPGEYAALSVTDSGVGIAPELVARIFEPFFTTKASDKGTGLGLSTCYGIVKQAGGVIWVYSEVGVGTTFKVYVPRVRENSAPSTRRRRTTSVRAGGDETLLVVEDDSQVRRVVAETLARQGYRVLTAQHGLDAIDVAGRHEGGIDLLITDVVMPKMGGPELAHELRSARPGLRVLFVSGYSEHAMIREGALGDQESLLEKPFSRDRLLERVRQLLDAHCDRR